MAIYSLAQRTTVTTIAAASHGILAAATSEPSLMEWGFFNGAATANVAGLARAGNNGTLSGGVLFQAEDVDRPASVTTASAAFTIAPTVPSQFFRRFSTAALIGSAVVFTFPRGIVLGAAAAPIVCWNITANSAVVDIHAVIDE
jgi:hypothetical protein